jgi:glycosyltransferase involved in cell wall biosynthesis
MPSRFLETFGLTALEALASGVHVIGFRKWWLVPFIPPNLALDHESPIDSFARMIRAIRLKAPPKKIDISPYQMPVWIEKFSELFPLDSHIALIHDYADHIGGAEIYLSEVMDRASHLGYSLSRFSFTYKTTPWKRRILFALSGLAFWRFFQVLYFCWSERPSVFWVHSILRYVWIWWVLAIRFYVNSTHSKIYLSHHDIGLIAPFPQDITDETQIPKNTSYTAFISGTKSYKKYLASLKWCYVRIIASLFPRNTEHIIFAPFLEMHIRAHFPDQKIHILPHAYDAEVYHP